jgi:hypothetical protein
MSWRRCSRSSTPRPCSCTATSGRGFERPNPTRRDYEDHGRGGGNGHGYGYGYEYDGDGDSDRGRPRSSCLTSLPTLLTTPHHTTPHHTTPHHTTPHDIAPPDSSPATPRPPRRIYPVDTQNQASRALKPPSTRQRPQRPRRRACECECAFEYGCVSYSHLRPRHPSLGTPRAASAGYACGSEAGQGVAWRGMLRRKRKKERKKERKKDGTGPTCPLARSRAVYLNQRGT